MAQDKIDGIGGVGRPLQVNQTYTGGPGATSSASAAHHSINENDNINLSDEAMEAAPAPQQAATPTSTFGVPGISSGGVITPTSSKSSYGAPGIHNSGVLVSGQAPALNILPGSAGKIFT